MIAEKYSLEKKKKLALTNKKSIDYIRKKAENNEYIIFEDFERDIFKLFAYTLEFRCDSSESYALII